MNCCAGEEDGEEEDGFHRVSFSLLVVRFYFRASIFRLQFVILLTTYVLRLVYNVLSLLSNSPSLLHYSSAVGFEVHYRCYRKE